MGKDKVWIKKTKGFRDKGVARSREKEEEGRKKHTERPTG